MHADLADALARAGFDPLHLPKDPAIGVFHRFAGPGKKRGDDSGWLKLHDHNVASFGVWGGETFTWRGASDRIRRDPAEIETARKTAAEKAQAASAAAIGTARHVWRHGVPLNDNEPAHPYAVRKNIRTAGLRVDRRGNLLVPVVLEPGGEIVNVQKISPDGEKRFIKGAPIAGGFFEIDGDGPAVFAEGLATAATVQQATGRRAVVAFFADNLKPVTAKIAQPGDLIAADNDNAPRPDTAFSRKHSTYGKGHKAAMACGLPFHLPHFPGLDFNDLGEAATAEIFARDPVSALPVFDAWRLPRLPLPVVNASTLAAMLREASTPEDAAARAYTVAAALAIRAPAAMALIEIRAFLETHLPPGAAHPATLDRILDRLALAQDHRRRAAIAHVTIPGDVLARHRHEPAGDLPSLSGADYSGVICIHAPMGSGKTQRIGRPLIDWAKLSGRKALAIAHRTSLVGEMAHRLDLPDYRTIDATFATWADGAAICLPSITSEALAPLVDRAEVLFIDEASQVVRFLKAERECSTASATNEGVFLALRDLVARAKTVIVADAGLDRRTVEFLESCRPGERFRIITMDPKPEGIEATFSVGATAPAWAIGELLAELEAGGNVWLSCESVAKARAYGQFFEDQGFPTLALTATNKGNAKQAAFLANAEVEAANYRVIVASPVVSSGLSIEIDHFTLGGVIASGNAVCPADALQQSRRVRPLRRYVIALQPNNQIGAQDPEAILSAWEGLARAEGTATRRTAFDALIADIEAGEANAKADFAAGLLWLLDRAKWRLTRATETAEGDLLTAIKAASAAVEMKHRADLIAAPVLSDDQAETLDRKADRTEAENTLLEAHRIRRGLNVDKITEATLDWWDGGRVLRRMDRFGAAQGIIPARQDTREALARRRFWTASARAYAYVFGDLDLFNAEHWLTDTIANQILDRVIAKRFLLAALGIVGPKYATWREDREGNLLPMARPKYAVQEVGDLLARMGLDMDMKRARCGRQPGHNPQFHLHENPPCGPDKPKDGTPKIRLYRATPESIAAMQAACDQRDQVRKTEIVVMPFRPVSAPVVGAIMATSPQIGAIFAQVDRGERRLRRASHGGGV